MEKNRKDRSSRDGFDEFREMSEDRIRRIHENFDIATLVGLAVGMGVVGLGYYENSEIVKGAGYGILSGDAIVNLAYRGLNYLRNE